MHGKALCQAVQMQRKILSSSSITRENSLYQAVQTQGKTPCIKQFKCKGKLPASSSSNTRKNSLYQIVQAQGKTPRIKLFKCRGKKNARENSLYQAVQTLGKTPCIKQFKCRGKLPVSSSSNTRENSLCSFRPFIWQFLE